MLIDGISLTSTSDISNLIVDSGTSFPDGTIGEIFYRTDLSALYVFNGSTWNTIGSTIGFDDLNIKPAVAVATTANITLSGTQTIDGYTTAVSDRVLVKNQALQSQNGIYVVSASAWTRASDFDGSPSTEVKSGDFVFVQRGSTQADTGWVLTTDGAITIGTTALTFAQFTGAAAAAGGSNAQVQYNNGGAFAGSTNFIFNGTNRIQLGAQNGSAIIQSKDGGSAANAGNLVLQGGTSGNPGLAGNVSVIAGNSFGTVPGGNVFISSGIATGTGVGGYLAFSTGPTTTLSERFRINPNGSWSVGTGGTAVGTAGQVLTSNGSASAPTWQTVGGNSVTLDTAQTVTGAKTFNNLSVVTEAADNATTKAASTAFVDRLRSVKVISTTGETAAIAARGAMYDTTGGITVPASVFAAGDTFAIYNDTASDLTVTQGAGLTLRLVGTATTGNRTLAQRGMASVVFITATEAVISGGGLT